MRWCAMITQTNISSRKRGGKLILLLTVLASVGVCASSGIAKQLIDRSDYGEIIFRMDTDMLQRTEVTQYYHDMMWRHTGDFYSAFVQLSQSEIIQFYTTIDLWMPNFRALLNGKGGSTVITSPQVEALTLILERLAANGSPAFRDDINRELERLHLPDFTGMTMQQAWVHLHEVWGVYDPPPASDYNDTNPYKTPTPFPTRTPEPTVIPRHVLTPEGTLESVEYARYWVEYRNMVSGYGFAYPADWILTKMEQYSPLYFLLRLCDRDVDYFGIERVEGICLFLVEEQPRIPASTFEQAIFDRFCNPDLYIQCEPIIIRSDIPGRPIRAELQYTPLFYDNHPTALAVFFQSTPEKLTYFFSTLEIMQTREAQAVVDSFVWGEDTSIGSPNFRPSVGIQ
jgi:hypothetical protein